MISYFRKKHQEIKVAEQNMESASEITFDLEKNIQTLQELSASKGAFFKVYPNHNTILIRQNPLNKLKTGMMMILYGLLIPGLFKNPIDPILPVFFLIISLMFFLIATFSSTTNDILIDFFKKNITIRSNDIIGKHTRKTVIITFEDYKGLKNEVTNLGNKGSIKINRIFIFNLEKKIKLIDLARSPYFIQYKAFINSFDSIIKNAKTSGVVTIPKQVLFD